MPVPLRHEPCPSLLVFPDAQPARPSAGATLQVQTPTGIQSVTVPPGVSPGLSRFTIAVRVATPCHAGVVLSNYFKSGVQTRKLDLVGQPGQTFAFTPVAVPAPVIIQAQAID